MPSVTLHLLLADRVSAELETRADPPPFDLRLPAVRNAFRQGSLGPDLGYFPGGHRFLSDLAHSVGAADLTRALIFGAKTALERAFAWGWATHVLADQRIHPWIGLAVGRLKEQRPWTFVSGDEDPVGHVRVEMGLDAWISIRHPEVSTPSLRPVFDGASIRFLSHAYRRYGLSLEPGVFLVSHSATTRMGRGALFAARALGREQARSRTPVMLRAARALLRARASVGRTGAERCVALAYLTPVSPEAWLLAEAEAEIRAFPGRFVELARDNFRTLENRNLDTGEPDPIRGASLQSAVTRISNSPPTPEENALTMIR